MLLRLRLGRRRLVMDGMSVVVGCGGVGFEGAQDDIVCIGFPVVDPVRVVRSAGPFVRRVRGGGSNRLLDGFWRDERLFWFGLRAKTRLLVQKLEARPVFTRRKRY